MNLLLSDPITILSEFIKSNTALPSLKNSGFEPIWIFEKESSLKKQKVLEYCYLFQKNKRREKLLMQKSLKTMMQT